MKNTFLVITIGVLIGALCLLGIGIYKNIHYLNQQKEEEVYNKWKKEHILGSKKPSMHFISGPLEESKNVVPKKLPSGWREEAADSDEVNNHFGYSGSTEERYAEVKLYNTTKQEKKFDYLIYQFNTVDQPIAKERIEYILKPNRQITKKFRLERGAAKIDVLHGSTKFVDGWKEKLHKEEFVGKEPHGSFQPWTSSSFGTDSCYVWLANEGNPKHLTIKVDHLDKFSDGAVIKSDTYTYDLGYNKEISRDIPAVKGEKFCSVSAYADDWDDTLYKEDLVGKEPSDSNFINASSSGVKDCSVWIANTGKPKHIAIEVTRLDNFKDGKVLKTDNYTYDLGYNRQISRKFPRVEGEKFCNVKTKVM